MQDNIKTAQRFVVIEAESMAEVVDIITAANKRDASQAELPGLAVSREAELEAVIDSARMDLSRILGFTPGNFVPSLKGLLEVVADRLSVKGESYALVAKEQAQLLSAIAAVSEDLIGAARFTIPVQAIPEALAEWGADTDPENVLRAIATKYGWTDSVGQYRTPGQWMRGVMLAGTPEADEAIETMLQACGVPAEMRPEVRSGNSTLDLAMKLGKVLESARQSFPRAHGVQVLEGECTYSLSRGVSDEF